jgi:hypothetical protein
MRSLWASLFLVFLISGKPADAQSGANLDDLAKELSNPGVANAALNFTFEYYTFRGTLPGALDQNRFLTIFQPTIPFVLPNGNDLIVRPSFQYVFWAPAATSGRFRLAL